MNKKYLFVGEYDDSYTGGSVVFISTKEFLKEFEMEGLKVISDPFENQLRKLRSFGGVDGIAPEKLMMRLREECFTPDFINYVENVISSDSFPGYKHNRRVRTDWFPQNDEGIYIVYEHEIDNESDEIEIISDTYYCG